MIAIHENQDRYANNVKYKEIETISILHEGKQVKQIKYAKNECMLCKVSRVFALFVITLASFGLILCAKSFKKEWENAISAFKYPIVYVRQNESLSTNILPILEPIPALAKPSAMQIDKPSSDLNVSKVPSPNLVELFTRVNDLISEYELVKTEPSSESPTKTGKMFSEEEQVKRFNELKDLIKDLPPLPYVKRPYVGYKDGTQIYLIKPITHAIKNMTHPKRRLEVVQLLLAKDACRTKESFEFGGYCVENGNVKVNIIETAEKTEDSELIQLLKQHLKKLI